MNYVLCALLRASGGKTLQTAVAQMCVAALLFISTVVVEVFKMQLNK